MDYIPAIFSRPSPPSSRPRLRGLPCRRSRRRPARWILLRYASESVLAPESNAGSGAERDGPRSDRTPDLFSPIGLCYSARLGSGEVSHNPQGREENGGDQHPAVRRPVQGRYAIEDFGLSAALIVDDVTRERVRENGDSERGSSARLKERGDSDERPEGPRVHSAQPRVAAFAFCPIDPRSLSAERKHNSSNVAP